MKALKNMCRWFINLLFIAAILLAAAVWLPKAFHIKAYVVKSSSMEPTIKVGSVIYVKAYDNDESISSGDIVSFHTGDVMVTHRIMSVNLENGTAITKGDGNEVCDSAPLPLSAIEGKVLFHIPAIGYLLLH